MKINWKLRFKNKTTLLALIAVGTTFIYQTLGLLGVTVPISEDMATQAVAVMVNILVAVGILVDPTTTGLSDSQSVLEK